jgi:hypothetical protein
MEISSIQKKLEAAREMLEDDEVEVSKYIFHRDM